MPVMRNEEGTGGISAKFGWRNKRETTFGGNNHRFEQSNFARKSCFLATSRKKEERERERELRKRPKERVEAAASCKQAVGAARKVSPTCSEQPLATSGCNVELPVAVRANFVAGRRRVG